MSLITKAAEYLRNKTESCLCTLHSSSIKYFCSVSNVWMGDTSFPEELVHVKILLSFLVGYTAQKPLPLTT